MDDRSKCSSNDGSTSKENYIILGKLIYSFEHLDSLMCLIVTNFVNGKRRSTSVRYLLYIYIYKISILANNILIDVLIFRYESETERKKSSNRDRDDATEMHQ